MTDAVAEKMSQIPKCTLVRYWHHVVLQLFKYLAYHRL